MRANRDLVEPASVNTNEVLHWRYGLGKSHGDNLYQDPVARGGLQIQNINASFNLPP